MTDPVLAHSTDHGRYYTSPFNRREVPSITNIKDVKNIEGLKYWAAGECATYVSENLERLRDLEPEEIYKLVKGAPFRKNSKKVQSALVGDIVHDWIDQVIKGAPVSSVKTDTYVDKEDVERKTPQSAKWMWNAFLKFLDTYRPEWVMSEFTVWSDKYGYAGTMDWAAKLGTGKRKFLTLGDNKTGNRVYPDMALQLAAGQFADFILQPDASAPDGYVEKEIPQYERFGILHLRPRSVELVPMVHIPEAFRAFLGLKAAFDWIVEYSDQTMLFTPKISVRAG